MAFSSRGKLYRTTVISGVLSISSFIILFTHQAWVTRHFTRGGVYAALPIVTAFYFSFVHGTFTSCLLSLLGVRVGRGAPARTPNGGAASQSEVRP